MLILSRKQGESIEFPGLDIVVRVVSLKGAKVQLGIDAPRTITVNRSEISSQTLPREKGDEPIDVGQRNVDRLDARDERRSENGSRDLEELIRLEEELVRLEAELAALAELAQEKERPAARRVAADSIERLESIKRTIQYAVRTRHEPRPIADLIKIRADVIEKLRKPEPRTRSGDTWSEATRDATKCVRQGAAGYVVAATGCGVA